MPYYYAQAFQAEHAARHAWSPCKIAEQLQAMMRKTNGAHYQIYFWFQYIESG